MMESENVGLARGSGDAPPAPSGDNRPPVYQDPDGTIVYRASSFGSCVQSLVAWRQNEFDAKPYSDEMLRIFAESAALEPLAVAKVAAEGWSIVNHGDDQLEYDLPVLPGVVVRCHPDGIAWRTGQPQHTTKRVLEVKALGDSLAPKGLHALTHYPWQLSIEMLSTGLRALYGVLLKGTEELVSLKEIDTPPHSLVEIKLRVAKIEALARKEDLPGCDIREYPCRWYGVLCDHSHKGVTAPELPVNDDTLTTAMSALYWARERKKAAAKDEDAAKRELLKGLGDRSVVIAGAFKTKVTKTEPARFDVTAFKEKEPELYEQYLKPTPTVKVDVEQLDDSVFDGIPTEAAS